jgi:hypothetical protein
VLGGRAQAIQLHVFLHAATPVIQMPESLLLTFVWLLPPKLRNDDRSLCPDRCMSEFDTPDSLCIASVVVCTHDNLGSSCGQTGNGFSVVVVLVMRSFRDRR